MKVVFLYYRCLSIQPLCICLNHNWPVVTGLSLFYSCGMSVCLDHAGAQRWNQVWRCVGRPTSSLLLRFFSDPVTCSSRNPRPSWRFKLPCPSTSCGAGPVCSLPPAQLCPCTRHFSPFFVVFDQWAKANKLRALLSPGAWCWLLRGGLRVRRGVHLKGMACQSVLGDADRICQTDWQRSSRLEWRAE